MPVGLEQRVGYWPVLKPVVNQNGDLLRHKKVVLERTLLSRDSEKAIRFPDDLEQLTIYIIDHCLSGSGVDKNFIETVARTLGVRVIHGMRDSDHDHMIMEYKTIRDGVLLGDNQNWRVVGFQINGVMHYFFQDGSKFIVGVPKHIGGDHKEIFAFYAFQEEIFWPMDNVSARYMPEIINNLQQMSVMTESLLASENVPEPALV